MTQYKITTKSKCSIGLNFLWKEKLPDSVTHTEWQSNFGVIYNLTKDKILNE